MQNIVYGQYLPNILGAETVKQYNLGIDQASTYNPDTDPSITNAFATAAYRFGHSMIRNIVKLIDIVTAAVSTYRQDIENGIFLTTAMAYTHNYELMYLYRLKDNFFDSSVYEAQMEAIIGGMMGQMAEQFDVNVVSDVTESLFANVDFPGSDLIARNIHRGRDHGLPGYNEYR